jgi:hypothetical protein
LRDLCHADTQAPVYFTTMKVELVVVSGRTLDTSPSFFILIDGVSYLFNVPDGTQRLFMQHKWKLASIKQIFFTSITPRRWAIFQARS